MTLLVIVKSGFKNGWMVVVWSGVQIALQNTFE